MIKRFIGRQRQLRALQVFYQAPDRHLATIRGRRRVGKSRLLLHSLEQGKSAYHQAAQLTPEANFARFREDMCSALQPLLPANLVADLTHAADWRSLILTLGQAAEQLGRLTVTIDEFPYLSKSDPSLESVLQEALGRIETAGNPLKLVLCGSSISQMEALLEHSSPLFGRSDLNLVLQPLDYLESAEFTPAWSPVELVHARTVFGGMPRYLNLLDDQLSVAENYERPAARGSCPTAECGTQRTQNLRLHHDGHFAGQNQSRGNHHGSGDSGQQLAEVPISRHIRSDASAEPPPLLT